MGVGVGGEEGGGERKWLTFIVEVLAQMLEFTAGASAVAPPPWVSGVTAAAAAIRLTSWKNKRGLKIQPCRKK